MDFCKWKDFYLFCSFIAHRKYKKIPYTKSEWQNIFWVLLTLADAYCNRKTALKCCLCAVQILTLLSLSLCSNPSGSSVSAPLPITACSLAQNQELILFDFACSTTVLSFFWLPHWLPHLPSLIFLSPRLLIYSPSPIPHLYVTHPLALNSFTFISPWEFNFLSHLIPVSYPY